MRCDGGGCGWPCAKCGAEWTGRHMVFDCSGTFECVCVDVLTPKEREILNLQFVLERKDASMNDREAEIISTYQAWTLTKWGSVPESAPIKEHLKNAGIGIAEEAIETYVKVKELSGHPFRELKSEKLEALVKELGDLAFYIAIVMQKLGLQFSSELHNVRVDPPGSRSSWFALLKDAGVVAGELKKFCFHDKPLEKTDLPYLFQELIASWQWACGVVGCPSGWKDPVAYVLEQNRVKLNARYVAKMTPAESLARVDEKRP